MFATIRRYQAKPGQTDEALRRVQEGLVPILTQQPGFVSYAVIDAGGDVSISVSLYDDRAAAEAANSTAGTWVRENLADLVGPANVTVGEVRIAGAATRV